jgi:alpha-methylacyl-CoA racemase
MADRAEKSVGGPLTGVQVVELAGLGPSQLGAAMLSDLGADVVRIDRPVGRAEFVGPPNMEVLSRGRRSIALDLKDAADAEVAWQLIERADVLVDPYRPGAAARLGFGPEPALERNPRLIYTQVTGWGQEGPLAAKAGHDINFVALAGALEPTGEAGRPPVPALNLVGDFGGGGMLMAVGVLAALVERGRSGRGQIIDVAMVDGVSLLIGSVIQLDAMGLWDEQRGSNWLQGAAPWYRTYETADGRYASVGALEPQFYRALLESLGLDPEQWPQFDRESWPRLTTQMARRFSARPLAAWEEIFAKVDACFAPLLRLGELGEHPHLAARETYVDVDGIRQPAPAPRFSRTPGSIAGPPPHPGQHSLELRQELGGGPGLRSSAA